MNQAFKALADPTRRKILDLLKEGDLTAGEIAEHFNMTKPSISHHLNALKNAELIQDEKKGQFVVYSLNTTVFQDLLTWVFTFTNKGKREMRKHLVAIILILITGLAWAYAWPNLPDTMAVHWGMEGVNGYASKFNAMLLLLGIMIFTYVLLTITPKIDPKKKNYDKFSKGYMIINYSVVVLLFLVNMLVIGVGLGYDIPMNSTPLILVGLLFIVIGNYLPQCKPNYFVGIKTPWTLSNEEVWRKTHRFSGKVFVVLGIIMILSVFVPATWKSFVMVGIIIGAVGLTMGYSYVAYKKN